jgi:EAL and modified HD-GYP domain-containing signal transduction protein
MDIFVARQPIFDLKKQVFAYELLFRNGFENTFPDIDGNVATNTLLSNTFFSFGLKELLRKKPGFINFTKDLILEKTPLLFPSHHMVIEVLENIEPDEQVINALDDFKNNGYQIALDDFEYQDRFQPMISRSDIIKIDFRATPENEITNYINIIREDHAPIFLAEKVETHQEYELAKAMGFSLFQGYFFSKPEIISKADISAGQITRLKLVAALQKEAIDIQEVEGLIKNDVGVSFKLLKFINSAYFRRPTPIDTIKDAITYMGLNELKKFIRIIAVSDLNSHAPKELLRGSVIRARMCEKIGKFFKTGFTADELFTLGLFTSMDAIMNHRMEDIIKVIGFSEDMNNALLGRVKSVNLMLSIINCVEQGDWGKKVFKAISGKAIEASLPRHYFDALKLSNSFFE